ncbi:hypothetical protein Leryth_007826 [Lithospermum erythrorhizon]|nr:hypothetical protein Leryth_007826 [Lithospermum erythrorhizon]
MMLSIKRVPTVVSNYQKEEAEDGARQGGGCGRNCFRSCCLPGSKLPLYAFKKLNKFDDEKESIDLKNKEPPIEFLNSLLLGEVIPGNYGFIAQLNEGKAHPKRKRNTTEFKSYWSLATLFKSRTNSTLQRLVRKRSSSNLNKARIMKSNSFQMHPLILSTVLVLLQSMYVACSPFSVVSPIEYGHVLLIPRILECLPQRIDRDGLLLALYLAVETANPYFRLGYNSLGAFATINHLHFQAYYLAVPFPVEKAPTDNISTTRNGVKTSKILNYPVRGLVFEGGDSLEDLSNVISDSCICLQENNIPYNVLIADSGKRVFLFPQCYAEKQALGEVSAELLDTQVNPAVWEISGHMVLKRKEDYEEASEGNAWKLLAEVSLSEERFEEVRALVFEAINCTITEDENIADSLLDKPEAVTTPEEVDTVSQGSHPAMVPV